MTHLPPDRLRLLLTMGHALQEVVQRNSQVRDALSPKHRAMVDKIVEIVTAPTEEMTNHLDADYWERWTTGFEVACRVVGGRPEALPDLQAHVEDGYRYVLLMSSPDIHAMEKWPDDTPLLVYGQEQIQQVLDEYDD